MKAKRGKGKKLPARKRAKPLPAELPLDDIPISWPAYYPDYVPKDAVRFRKKPKRVASWRTCPNCGSKATKIACANPVNGKMLTCQICDHEYNPPEPRVSKSLVR